MASVTSDYGFWLLLIDWIVRVGALLWIPSRTTPAAARSWLLFVGFVPLLGLPLYLLFGHPWLSRQRLARQHEASAFIAEAQAAPARSIGDAMPAGIDATVPALVEHLGGLGPTWGNRIALIDDYEAAWRRLIDDIDAATERVHLLYYLLFDDAVGDAVVDAVLRAAARGVRCRVLLDAIGAKRGLRHYGERLRAGGVQLHAMLPGGLRWRRSGRMDLRNHRKIAVIDHRVAYVGSQNLAEAGFVPGCPNRELVARVEGDVLAELAIVFASDWFVETGERLDRETSDRGDAGTVVAQALPSGPSYPFENARDVLNRLIHQARRELVLVTPYFVPDDATLVALRTAALSGVAVTLVLSASNNQRLTAWAQHAYYEDLLGAGVRIALYRPHFLHAKHLSVDDEIALVGSINLDIRSFALNAEIGLLCYDAGVVARMREVEADYLANADIVQLDAWKQRPAWHRSREGIARLADSLM